MLVNLGSFNIVFGGQSVILPSQTVQGGNDYIYTLGANPLSTIIQYGYLVVTGVLSSGSLSSETNEVYEWYPDLSNRYFRFSVPDLGQPQYDLSLKIKPIQQFRLPASPATVDVIARFWNLPV